MPADLLNEHDVTRDIISPVRIVLDTSAVIAALRSNAGAAAEVLRLCLAGRVTLLMDFKLACEYSEVAMRTEQLKASKRTVSETKLLLDALELVAEPVMVLVRHRPLSQDPDDDMVLDVAINGGAGALVTHNAKHFRSAASRFHILTLSPSELLRRLARG